MIYEPLCLSQLCICLVYEFYFDPVVCVAEDAANVPDVIELLRLSVEITICCFSPKLHLRNKLNQRIVPYWIGLFH